MLTVSHYTLALDRVTNNEHNGRYVNKHFEKHVITTNKVTLQKTSTIRPHWELRLMLFWLFFTMTKHFFKIDSDIVYESFLPFNFLNTDFRIIYKLWSKQAILPKTVSVFNSV